MTSSDISPDMFNFVSQQAHWLSTAWITLIGLYFFGPGSFWYTIPVLVVYAAIKEFWYDQQYENAATRGSNLEDFSFYLLGIVITLICWWLHIRYTGA